MPPPCWWWAPEASAFRCCSTSPAPASAAWASSTPTGSSHPTCIARPGTRCAECGQEKSSLAAARVRALNPEVRVEAHALRLDAAQCRTAVRRPRPHPRLQRQLQPPSSCSTTSRCAPANRCCSPACTSTKGSCSWCAATMRRACLRCVWPEATRDGLVGNCAEAGVLGPVPGVFGSLQALEALKLPAGSARPRTRRNADLRSHHPEHAAPACAAPAGMRGASARGQRRRRCRHPRNSKCSSARSPTRRGAGFTFVDVRDSRERDAEPLPADALHLPMSKLLTDAATLDLAGRYLLICATGKRSAAAAELLRSQGFARVPLACAADSRA